ncbi:MAG: V-type ATP synthase subunit D [Defluviitaleaceae bacterium]|nr:V-type ATP synthase subunit D [Defluviitaleaceae bacterium]
MEQAAFPTKGNLLRAKNTLALSKQGYELLDKKRGVLIRELMLLNEQAGDLQKNAARVFASAYAALQEANIEMGIYNVELFSYGVPADESVNVRMRSIMGVEVPIAASGAPGGDSPCYGLGSTTAALDSATIKFSEAKEILIRLASVENSARNLALNIRKTTKRANALKNVTIPKFETRVKTIQDTLEERERDEFTRQKKIKSNL